MRHLLFAALLLLCCAYGCIATAHTSQVWPGREEPVWGTYVVKGGGGEVEEGGWKALRIAVDSSRLFNEFEFCGESAKMVTDNDDTKVGEKGRRVFDVSGDDKTVVEEFDKTGCVALRTFSGEKARELVQNVLPEAAKMHVDRLAIKRGDDGILHIRSKTGYIREPCKSYIPERHRSSGLPNVDFVVYVGLWNDGTSTTICSFDEKTGRPTSAVIRFNVGDLELLKLKHIENDRERAVRIVAHEIAHGLGFSTKASKFSELMGPTKDRKHVELVSDKIIKALRSYDCEKASGMRIDDNSMDKPYPHFDGSIVKNELMSPYDVIDEGNDMVYSKLTLAVFESTGYYKADYEKAEVVTVERVEGCSSRSDE